MATNEILPFGTGGTVEDGDVMALTEYLAAADRVKGNQPGIANRALVNMALRQTGHISAGVARFIANRYAAGVVDDGDLAKVEAGLLAAINAIIGATVDLAHFEDTDNPHEVTAEQVGAAAADHTHDDAAPTGTIRAIDSETVPSGYHELDGSMITVAEDAALVAVVGTKHVPNWSAGETVASGVLRRGLSDGSVYISTSSGTTSGTDIGDDTGVTWTASTSVYLGDWRGRFARGWDHGLGLDSGRQMGSTQADAFQGHGHNLRTDSTSYACGHALSRAAGASSAYAAGGDGLRAREAIEHAHGSPREADETRPVNIATMWIIKR
ncbi:MAG: hypothetical protein KKE73_07520 [Proteobacteria bacterium]|nr:hypothetical protein [Pseudomonadota bacterium]